MSSTFNIPMTYLEGNQASEEVIVNNALNIVDGFLNRALISRTTSAQPGSPSEGDMYLVPTGATGADWSGQDGKVALYYGGWLFFTVREGWKFWIEDEDIEIVYGGAEWWVAYGDLLVGDPFAQRVVRPRLPADTGGAWGMTSQTAYFVYLGPTLKKFTPLYVAMHILISGSSVTDAEVGFFSTPLPPNKSGQTLTKLVSGALAAVTSTGFKRNSTPFGTAINPDVHLWAGVRIHATGMPSTYGLAADLGGGSILRTASAGTFAATSSFAGALIPASVTAGAAALLQMELD